MEVKYPQITVKLVGEDGNAFNVMGLVARAMRRGGCTPDQVKEYQSEAMQGSYDELLQTTMKYVNVE